MANTLFDKIWDAHVVQKVEEGPTQLYIDRLYCHEVTSPQAFAGLRARGVKVGCSICSGTVSSFLVGRGMCHIIPGPLTSFVAAVLRWAVSPVICAWSGMSVMFQ